MNIFLNIKRCNSVCEVKIYDIIIFGLPFIFILTRRVSLFTLFYCLFITHITIIFFSGSIFDLNHYVKTTTSFLLIFSSVSFFHYVTVTVGVFLLMSLVFYFFFLFFVANEFATGSDLLQWSYVLTPSVIWGVFFFTFTSYIVLVYTMTNYILAFYAEINSSKSVLSSRFIFLHGTTALSFYQILPFLLVILISSWSGSTVLTAFGHISFTLFERKMMILILLFSYLYSIVFFSSASFSTTSSYDYVSSLMHFSYWLMFLFLTTNLLSLIFVVEVLTGLIVLLIITSYNNATSISSGSESYFNNILTPTIQSTYFYSILTFFWTSLLTTLTLFLFLLLMYTNFLTLEWSLVTPLFAYFVSFSTPHALMTLSLSWMLVLFVIFLKCAITPFFLWKPTFFKGLPYHTLLYYIFIFYFFLFLFFVHFLIGLFTDFLYLNTFLLSLVMFLTLLILPSILYETLNVKSFFALSSILNSSIVLLATLNVNILTTPFFL